MVSRDDDKRSVDSHLLNNLVVEHLENIDDALLSEI